MNIFLKTEYDKKSNNLKPDENLGLKRINTSKINSVTTKNRLFLEKEKSKVSELNKFKNPNKSYSSLVKLSSVFNKTKDQNNLFNIYDSVKKKLGITDDLIEQYLLGSKLNENLKDLTVKNNNSEYFKEKNSPHNIPVKILNIKNESFKANKFVSNDCMKTFSSKEDAINNIFNLIINKDYDQACEMYKQYTKHFMKNDSIYETNEKKIKPKELLNLLIDYKFKIMNFNVEKTFSEINYGNDHELYNKIK